MSSVEPGQRPVAVALLVDLSIGRLFGRFAMEGGDGREAVQSPGRLRGIDSLGATHLDRVRGSARHLTLYVAQQSFGIRVSPKEVDRHAPMAAD